MKQIPAAQDFSVCISFRDVKRVDNWTHWFQDPFHLPFITPGLCPPISLRKPLNSVRPASRLGNLFRNRRALAVSLSPTDLSLIWLHVLSEHVDLPFAILSSITTISQSSTQMSYFLILF